MPTIKVDFEDFQSLLGFKLSKEVEELDDILSHVKGEVKFFNGEELDIEIKDTNRPDLWNVEGLARTLRGFLGIEKGLKRYEVSSSSGIDIYVKPELQKIRPYIACAVLKNIKLNSVIISEILRYQEKLDQTYGRKRQRASIGIYDSSLISPPLQYGVAKPAEISFVPLDYEEEMTLKEILEKHPKGIEYGHIVRRHAVWPILLDSKGKVLSFPPIINSNYSGKITKNTREVLIEVTGTLHKTVLNTLTAITLSLADRGGKIYSSIVHYPFGKLKDNVTPQLRTQNMQIDMEYLNKVLGLELKSKEAAELMEMGRYGVSEVKKDTVTVEIPCYRIDIMHPIDIVEDIMIAYGYKKIEPNWPQLPTIGDTDPEGRFCDLVREIFVGLGFQEVLTFTMVNPEEQFMLMNRESGRVVEISNPKVLTLTCLRSWLLPSLMEFLSHNTHVEYPQKIFEVGYAVTFDKKRDTRTRDINKLACLTIHSNANFSEIRSVMDALCLNLGMACKIEEAEHPSFIKGRMGKVVVNSKEVGIMGEINPKVVENWKLGNPIAAFEINLSEIFSARAEI